MDINYADIEIGTKIGSGNFGAVYKGDYLGTEVAVKEFFNIPGWDYNKYIERETSILKETRHPNVVQYLGCFNRDGKVFIVTEFVSGGNLHDWIVKTPIEKQTWRLKISFSTDIARALAYLHAHKIIHRDLKGGNLLITENNRVKICDFGFSRVAARSDEEKKRLSFCGTDAYMAPEIILCTEFDERVDVFSFGIILCELIMGQSATDKNLPREIPGFGIKPEMIRAYGQKVSEDCPPEFIELAIKCTSSEANDRPGWKDILKTLNSMEASLSDKANIGIFKHRNSSQNDVSSSNPPSSLTTPIDALEESPTSAAEQGESAEVSSLPGTPELRRTRMGHNIPHRFSIVTAVNASLSRCKLCKKYIGIGKHLRCDDCGVSAHQPCGSRVPPDCGLSIGLQEASLKLL